MCRGVLKPEHSNCTATTDLDETRWVPYEFPRCGMVNSAGNWYAAPCSQKKPAICSFPKMCDYSVIDSVLEDHGIVSHCDSAIASGASCDATKLTCKDSTRVIQNTFVCRAGRLSLTPSCESASIPQGCPHGWTSHNDQCWKSSDAVMSWAGSHAACGLMNAGLAPITSKGEYDLVRDLAGLTPDDPGIWFGVYEDSLIDYTSIDGRAVTYTNWRASDPNNFFQERTDYQLCDGAPNFKQWTSLTQEECAIAVSEHDDCSNIFFMTQHYNEVTYATDTKCGCITVPQGTPGPLVDIHPMFNTGTLCTCQNEAGCNNGAVPHGGQMNLMPWEAFELRQCARLGMKGATQEDPLYYDSYCSEFRKAVCVKQRSCGPHKAVPDITSTCDGLDSGTVCAQDTLSCPEGQEISGNFECLDGEYISQAQCVPGSCDPPPTSDDGLTNTCDSVPHNGVCSGSSLSCDQDDHEVHGQFKCSMGTYVETATCRLKSCEIPDHDGLNLAASGENGRIPSGMSYDATNGMVCKDGYEFIGEFTCNVGELTSWGRCHPIDAQNLGRCPVDWHYEGGSCYFADPNPGTWFETNARCEAYGGSLAVITSENQHLAVRDLAAREKFSDGTWIGLYASGGLGQNRWTYADKYNNMDFSKWRSSSVDMAENNHMQLCEVDLEHADEEGAQGTSHLVNLVKPEVDAMFSLDHAHCAQRAAESPECNSIFFYGSRNKFQPRFALCACVREGHQQHWRFLKGANCHPDAGSDYAELMQQGHAVRATDESEGDSEEPVVDAPVVEPETPPVVDPDVPVEEPEPTPPVVDPVVPVVEPVPDTSGPTQEQQELVATHITDMGTLLAEGNFTSLVRGKDPAMLVVMMQSTGFGTCNTLEMFKGLVVQIGEDLSDDEMTTLMEAMLAHESLVGNCNDTVDGVAYLDAVLKAGNLHPEQQRRLQSNAELAENPTVTTDEGSTIPPMMPSMSDVSANELFNCAVLGNDRDHGRSGAEEFWYAEQCSDKLNSVCSINIGCGAVSLPSGAVHNCPASGMRSGQSCEVTSCPDGNSGRFVCHQGEFVETAMCGGGHCGAPVMPVAKLNVKDPSTCNSLADGQSCYDGAHIQCDPGFVMKGEWRCENGNVITPTCEPDVCGELPAQQGITVAGCGALHHGQDCPADTVKCDNGKNVARTYHCSYGDYLVYGETETGHDEYVICMGDDEQVNVETGFKTTIKVWSDSQQHAESVRPAVQSGFAFVMQVDDQDVSVSAPIFHAARRLQDDDDANPEEGWYRYKVFIKLKKNLNFTLNYRNRSAHQNSSESQQIW